MRGDKVEAGSWFARGRSLSGEGWPLEVPAGPRQESRPVGTRGVPAAVLAESDISVDQRRFDRRELGGAQILLAQEPVNGTGARGGQEHALRIYPPVPVLRGTGTDEHGA